MTLMPDPSARAMIEAFGRSIGIDDLRLDEAGQCRLKIDAVEVNLELQADAAQLVVYAELGRLPEAGHAAIFARLLEANLFWHDTGGATLSIDRGHQQLLLARAVPLTSDPLALSEIIERFVDVAEAWSAWLVEQSQEPGTATPPNVEIDPSRYA